MEPGNEGIREGLLARLPRPEDLPHYREEVAALIARNEKRLRREHWYAGVTFMFAIGLGILLLIGSAQPDKPNAAWRAAWAGSFACFFLIAFAGFVTKLHINRARLEVLKEIKQVQLQVLELHEMLRKERAS